MHVLFEEDGAFKPATILTQTDTSLQVETPHGKRVKLKTANVLMQFHTPAASELMAAAEREAEGLETDFLYEVCGEGEFLFSDLAAEYFGHVPSAVESVALLLKLQASPVHFHRKGKGRFRKAPPEILQAALAGLEKKRLQQETIERYASELEAGRLPAEVAAIVTQLLVKPDRNKLETKGVELACERSGRSLPQLLLACGAFANAHAYHRARFLSEHFPEGIDFPPHEVPEPVRALERADVRAFSIDDATTTEIDDAFSVTPRDGGGWRVGIHIAAPGIGMPQGSPLDAVARKRLSTVYMPGDKITMMPDDAVSRYTLSEGRDCPAVSLYLDVNADLSIAGHSSRVEIVPVAANLRHHDIEPVFNEDTLAGELPDFPWRDELKLLWELATVLEAGRGKPSANQNAFDFNFYVDWSVETADGPGLVDIQRRKRGSPLDKLVAELMIAANSTWGRVLADAGIPAIYRAQTGGRVRMTTAAAPHDGLGVDCYAWSSSPLRRYVDLVNQRQLIAHLCGETAPFAKGSAELAAAMNDFELAYAAYADYQRQMERYWCLRWLRQQGPDFQPEGHVWRENLVRLDAIPLVIKVHSLPDLPAGSHVRLAIERYDDLAPDLAVRYLETLAPDANVLPGDEEDAV
ncbi:RNB domain-containing ribonuclease [Niveibacterium sp. 24ML]|uniref:ribonuclease catalytic domain-containing protein n=1 Tax=Niveibacterium sp. 24ML TaxID=2985512 RepID=UPI0022706AC8|nr:RNB domain-containing ribonuclease [Niveibacterium sp. 24ML]MCX9155464.1 RNB domain-containing ribonuclease [Niveibacterium sp. 24ML]